MSMTLLTVECKAVPHHCRLDANATVGVSEVQCGIIPYWPGNQTYANLARSWTYKQLRAGGTTHLLAWSQENTASGTGNTPSIFSIHKNNKHSKSMFLQKYILSQFLSHRRWQWSHFWQPGWREAGEFNNNSQVTCWITKISCLWFGFTCAFCHCIHNRFFYFRHTRTNRLHDF